MLKVVLVRSKDADGSAVAGMASFEGKPSREPSTFMLTGPPIDNLATIEMFCRRSRFPRVRILQQASVMLGHCRMRSRSKPQLQSRYTSPRY